MLRERDTGQAIAVGEGMLSDGRQCLGKREVGQLVTAIKSTAFNGFHAVGELDGGQVVAAFKCALPDLCDARSRVYGFQPAQPKKRIGRDLLHGVRDDDFFDTREAVPRNFGDSKRIPNPMLRVAHGEHGHGFGGGIVFVSEMIRPVVVGRACGQGDSRKQNGAERRQR